MGTGRERERENEREREHATTYHDSSHIRGRNRGEICSDAGNLVIVIVVVSFSVRVGLLGGNGVHRRCSQRDLFMSRPF
jgi:hypothetical protein